MWFVPSPLGAVAERRGLAAARGVAVTGTRNASSDAQFAALRDRTQDAVITAMDNVILWNRRPGCNDLRILAQTDRTAHLAVFARSGIAGIEQLRRGRILVDSAANGFVVALRLILAEHGVDFADCDVIEAGGVAERFAALAAGEGDATLLGAPFIERAEALGLVRLADVDTRFPGFPGLGLVARQSLAPERRDELTRWLSALEEARIAAIDDPAGAAEAVAAQGVPSAAAAGLVAAIADTLVPDSAAIRMLIDQRARLGLPGADTAVDELLDLGPITAALADVPARRR